MKINAPFHPTFLSPLICQGLPEINPKCEKSQPKQILMRWVTPSSGSNISLFCCPAHTNPVWFFHSKKNEHLNQFCMLISQIIQDNITRMRTFIFSIMFPCHLVMRIVIEQATKADRNGLVIDDGYVRSDEWNGFVWIQSAATGHTSMRERCSCTRIINYIFFNNNVSAN